MDEADKRMRSCVTPKDSRRQQPGETKQDPGSKWRPCHTNWLGSASAPIAACRPKPHAACWTTLGSHVMPHLQGSRAQMGKSILSTSVFSPGVCFSLDVHAQPVGCRTAVQVRPPQPLQLAASHSQPLQTRGCETGHAPLTLLSSQCNHHRCSPRRRKASGRCICGATERRKASGNKEQWRNSCGR